MTIKSRRIRQRHIAVDILASIIGADIFYTFVNKSWVTGIVAVGLSGVLYFLDRESIENEEAHGDTDRTH